MRSSASSASRRARRPATARSPSARSSASAAAPRRRSSRSTTAIASGSHPATCPRSWRSCAVPARAAAEEPAIVLAGGVEEPLRDLASYRAVGGYAQLERARALTPQAVTEQLIQSNLRGRGGAVFPTRPQARLLPTPEEGPETSY